MPLSEIQLEAFHEVARTQNFSRAARNLGVTQSALSQRILNLESELGHGLLIRDRAGARLTEAGETLLRYCKVRLDIESELLHEIRAPKSAELAGQLRVGAYSTVVWSVVAPALGAMVRENPGIQFEFVSGEMRELPAMLRLGEIDFAIVDHKPERADVRFEQLGEEENVLVEPARDARSCRDTYLDHDSDDRMTLDFLKLQGKVPAKLKRAYMDDIQGIIAGVRLGWGRAVISRHLVEGDRTLRIVPGLKPLKSPVYVHYPAQPYYSKLHGAVLKALRANFAGLMEG